VWYAEKNLTLFSANFCNTWRQLFWRQSDELLLPHSRIFRQKILFPQLRPYRSAFSTPGHYSSFNISQWRSQPKIWGEPKCLILGKQQYFVWDTSSKSPK